MRNFATTVMNEHGARLGAAEWVALTTRAEAVPIEVLLGRALDGAIVAWDPWAIPHATRSAGGAPWALAGRGETIRLDAHGEGRVGAIGAQAERAFARLLELREPGCVAPEPRFLGGFAFQPEELRQPPWAAFGDASFAMPRWLYGRSARDAFLRLTVRRDELEPALLDEIAHVTAQLREASGAALRKGEGPATEVRCTEETDVGAWERLVRSALGQIRARSLDKVVAARRSHLAAQEPFDVVLALERMRSMHSNSVRFAVQRGDAVFLGATPERLVSLRGRVARTEALAGSIARRLDGDAEAQRALFASEKERHEHALVVLGIEAALSRLGAALEIPGEPGVRTLRDVHHLCTPIVARLPEHVHCLDLLAALHPTPAVCGLPRDRASAWIASHETAPRGWYAGPVGWFDAQGDGAFVVALRSAVVRAAEAWLYAGAGIVEGSDAAQEYVETTIKQATMLRALGVSP